MRRVYPAIFEYDENDKAYNVSFPDVEGCITFGYSLEEALANADDVLNFMLSCIQIEGRKIPEASKLEDIEKPKSGFVQYVFADTRRFYEYEMQNYEAAKKIRSKLTQPNEIKALYPARIYLDPEDNTYWVDIPDFKGECDAIVFGENLLEVYEHARDDLNLYLCGYEEDHGGKKPPEPSKLEDFHAKDGEIYTYICVDTENYKKFIKAFKLIQEQEEALKQTA